MTTQNDVLLYAAGNPLTKHPYRPFERSFEQLHNNEKDLVALIFKNGSLPSTKLGKYIVAYANLSSDRLLTLDETSKAIELSEKGKRYCEGFNLDICRWLKLRTL